MTSRFLEELVSSRPWRTIKRYGKYAFQRACFGRAPRDKRCLFVGGVQRSGTNLLMQILDRSLETDVYHESDPRAFDNFLMRDEETIGALVARSNAPVVVFKALCELQHLQRLRQRFEPSRIVWIYRDYHDVANSMIAAFRTVPETVREVARNGPEAGWWGEGLSDETLNWLRSMVDRDPDRHTCGALLWYIRNSLFFENGLDRDPRVLVIRYEDLVSRPEAVLRSVSRFAGIRYSQRFPARVHGLSIGRRSKPQIDGPVEQACHALLARFDELERAGVPDPGYRDADDSTSL